MEFVFFSPFLSFVLVFVFVVHSYVTMFLFFGCFWFAFYFLRAVDHRSGVKTRTFGGQKEKTEEIGMHGMQCKSDR